MGSDKEKLQALEHRIERLELQFLNLLPSGPSGKFEDSYALKPKEHYTIFERRDVAEYFGVLDFSELRVGDTVAIRLFLLSNDGFELFREAGVQGVAKEPLYTFGPIVCGGIRLELEQTTGRGILLPFSIFWRRWGE